MALLQQALHREHAPPPDDAFPLGHPREPPLRRRCQALCVAPLLGSATLTAFETRAPPWPTRRGRGDHRATLGPLLGQRERLNAAEALRPALVPHPPGQVPSVEGPMLAFGTRVARPKGQSTMRGRSMAGAQARIAHHAVGQARLVASHPPARPLSQGMVASGQQVGEATGITRCVIDRAVNALALACACAPQGWGVRCRLDDHEPAGLASCDATLVETREDGPRVESGPGTVPRHEAPRPCVLVEPATGQTLGSWGTAQGRDMGEGSAWPHG